MKCNKIQDKLSDYLEKESSDFESKAIKDHVKDCSDCSEQLRLMRLVISEATSLNKIQAPDSIWHNIEAELDAQQKSLFGGIVGKLSDLLADLRDGVRVPAPVFQIAGVAAILLIGVLIGRFFLPSASDNGATYLASDTELNVQLVNARASNYIEKSQVLFLGIVNADAGEFQNMDMSREKSMARSLIQEASFLRENLSDNRNARIKQLVEELELILFEIANLEEQQNLDDVELIKSGIDRRGIMLKITLHDLAPETGLREQIQSDI